MGLKCKNYPRFCMKDTEPSDSQYEDQKLSTNITKTVEGLAHDVRNLVKSVEPKKVVNRDRQLLLLGAAVFSSSSRSWTVIVGSAVGVGVGAE